MRNTESPKTMFDQVLEEHRELREAMASLREFCAKPRPDVGTEDATAWASDLAQRLVKFHDRAYRHFHEEESSGFLEEICQAFPHIARTATAMEAEHEQLLADLRALLEAAMVYAENRPPESLNLRRHTLTLLDGFEQHEHEETGLVQRLLNEDLGSGD